MIWVIQPGFVGDVTLSLPFLYRACEVFPHESFRVYLRGPGIDLVRLALQRGLKGFSDRVEIVPMERAQSGLRWMLEQRQFHKPETVFCLHRSFRSGLAAWLSGAPVRVGFSSGSSAFFYTHAVVRQWSAEPGRARSEVEKNLDCLRALAEDVPSWDPVRAPSLLKDPLAVPGNGDRPVGVALGSPWPTKRYPVEQAAVLVRKLVEDGKRVLLLGDKSAVPLADELLKLFSSVLIENKVGQTSISEWVDEVGRCSLLVSGDSAGVHVASDLGVPVLALFGPTLPEFGFAPWRKGSKALGVQGLECRPCDIHGPRQCPKGHFRCMKDLSANIVFEEVKRFDRKGNQF